MPVLLLEQADFTLRHLIFRHADTPIGPILSESLVDYRVHSIETLLILIPRYLPGADHRLVSAA